MEIPTSPLIADDEEETIKPLKEQQTEQDHNEEDNQEFINKTKLILQNSSNLDINNKQTNDTSLDQKQNIIVPNITIHSGPPPPKRNVAVKNTAAHLNLNKTQPETSKTNARQQTYRVNEDEIMEQEEKEVDSNDEYVPPKNIREDSDFSESDEASSKRKSNRLIKKPKILEEFFIDSDNNSNQDTSTLTTSRITIEPKSLNNNAPKSTARKSTAPLTTSNLNQFNIQRQQTKPVITQTTPVLAQSNQNLNNISSNSSKTSLNKHVLNGTSNTSNKPIGQTIQNTNSLSSKSQTNSTSTQATSSAVINQTQTNNSNNPNQKQFRNKIVSCKPFYQSKSTECFPIVKDASTQIDLDEIKLSHTVVPVPVPINVPVPMCMYQAPMPIPILMPVPIPVPVFIPTTKKTFDRVQRRIKKLRKKLPSDPYEFEILLYAEKLAREEGIPGFEDSSDGESDTDNDLKRNFLDQTDDQLQVIQNENEASFKWNIGVKVFNTWLNNKIENLKPTSSNLKRLPNDLLRLKNEELNLLLAEFLNEVRKPNGEIYAPESIYYICLGIQHYLQEKGRVENIFLDSNLFDQFQEQLNEIATRYKIRIDGDGQVASRIEEEILWESKQLGAFSPFVLLNTILYFNTKYFFLDKVESHKKLSFTNVKKHSKRNIGPNGEDYGKTVFLRYYPDFHGIEQVIYEQGENYDNPLRCPVELYNFYLSKCPESVKNRNDVFYLLPEKASLPTSPVWFSSQPLGDKMLERMLNRIKMVKEVNELLLAAAPATTPLIVQ